MIHWPSGDGWGGLLHRPFLQGDATTFASALAGKAILITGAAGSIGSSLARAIVPAGPRLVVLQDNSATILRDLHQELSTVPNHADCISIPGDVCDVRLLNDLFGCHRPEIVFHAAALKDVPFLEKNPLAAIRTNTLGTYTVADSAVRHGAARMIYICTDKAVSPASMLGASKRLGELIVLALNTPATRINSVRFGNVLGSRGSVVPLFEEQIGRKGPVTVTHPDVSRYFLTGEEAVLLALAASSFDEGGRVLVPLLGEPVKIGDLARWLIRRAGLVPDKDIAIVFTRLRPGDKLTESLTAPFETRTQGIPGLLDCVVPKKIPLEQVRSWIAGLSGCLAAEDAGALVDRVCEIISDYQPSPELLELARSGRAQAGLP
jgi:FlaA1/EpsC-like NDP-sugar epimerase